MRRFMVGVAAAALSAAVAGAAEGPATARGEYVFRATGCANCHTDRTNNGASLAGGRRLETKFGIFYAPNITPDPETGIGRWTETDFMRAMREGLDPQGRHYYPSFPYAAYTKLGDGDLKALWAYLRTQAPVKQANREHELRWFMRNRAAVFAWKNTNFRPGAFRPDPSKDAEWNRGAYLVRAATHCGECHTPRGALGGPKTDQELSGSRGEVEGGTVPNITPDKKTGIGQWSIGELVEYLESGMTPDGDFAGDLMAEMIEHSLKYLTKGDRRAIAVYLFSRPAIENSLKRDKKKKPAGE